MANRPLPRGVRILLVIAGLIAGASLIKLILAEPSPREHFHALRTELQSLRVVADSCQEAVTREQAEFDAYNARLDSLRGRIDSLESLDPRGVPADSYEIYLDAFERYNAGVPDWEPAAESLRAHWQACRALVRQHNELADSARELAEELDLLPADPPRPELP